MASNNADIANDLVLDSVTGTVDYEEDAASFRAFLREHTVSVPLDADDDDDALLDEDPLRRGTRRVSAYGPQLRRLKRGRLRPEDNVVEVDLEHLRAWDPVRGGDLADRARRNAVRYRDVFCGVVDELLEDNDETTEVGEIDSNDGADEVVEDFDALREQRLANRRRRLEEMEEARRRRAAGQDVDEGPLAGELESDRAAAANPQAALEEEFPPALMRRYELRIVPRNGTRLPRAPRAKTLTESGPAEADDQRDDVADGASLRRIRSKSVGRLVSISGMIVRASDVRPQCVVATYTCDRCGVEVYQDVSRRREFLPLRKCPNPRCADQSGETLHLQTRGSRFVKYQELRLQELPSQVPMGHVPRSMPVHCRGELARAARPGDVVTVDGVFLPAKGAEGGGWQAAKAGLITTTYLEATNVRVHRNQTDDRLDTFTVDSRRLLLSVAASGDPLGRLSRSIAPEIHGHADVKRALLLQLVGGVRRKLPDGMRVRGDVNVCLMGDPGVAKSQLLRRVAAVAPRGVYTTGRGSSGVGLTAAVHRDDAGGEPSLEGGALVLADRGVCCVDEFDKMDESDRTALHEVMEQQTVSVAKAGIVATLNARTAVLAAANPLWGRYDRRKSLSENVNLPNSLLSRFDLVFLMIDEADADKDAALARHVTGVHQDNGPGGNKRRRLDEDGGRSTDGPEAVHDDVVDDDRTRDTSSATNDPSSSAADDAAPLPMHVLREYLARARDHEPLVPADVAPYVVEAYVGLRQQDQRTAVGPSDQTVMTARQLLSILRLSQALARLRFSDEVAREDVDEAIRLTHASRASLTDDNDEQGGVFGNGTSNGGSSRHDDRGDVVSRIFHTLRDHASATRTDRVEMSLCEAMVVRKGFTMAQLNTCLEEYQNLQVISVNAARTHVEFLSDN